MGKNKKNKKSKLYKTLKPYISDPKIMWSIIGAAAAGVALAAAFGTEKGKEIVDKVAVAAKDLIPYQEENAKKNSSTSKKQNA